MKILSLCLALLAVVLLALRLGPGRDPVSVSSAPAERTLRKRGGRAMLEELRPSAGPRTPDDEGGAPRILAGPPEPPPTATLSVHVASHASGRAVGGVELRVRTPDGHVVTGRSDEQGSWSGEVEAERDLVVNARAVPGVNGRGSILVEPLAPDERRSVQVRVVSFESSLQGRVLAMENGRPLAGVEVRLLRRHGFRSGRPLPLERLERLTGTDSLGVFAFGTEAGDGAFAFHSRGRSPKLALLEDADPGHSFEVRLPPSATLAGRVLGVGEDAYEIRVTTEAVHLRTGSAAAVFGLPDLLWRARVRVDGGFEVKDLPVEAPLKVALLRESEVVHREERLVFLKSGEERWVQWDTTGR